MSARSIGKRLRRGATMTEYALLIVGVLLIGAGAIKLLGGKLSARMNSAGDEATSSESHSSGGDTSSGGNASSGNAKSTSSKSGGGSITTTNTGSDDEKASVTSKASVGGAHDKNAAPAPSSQDKNQPNGDANVSAAVETTFGLRKGFALAMMVLGIGTILFFLLKTRKAVKDVREAGK